MLYIQQAYMRSRYKTLSNPHCTLAPPMTIPLPFLNLLAHRLDLPDLPKLEILIPSPSSDRTSIRTQRSAQDPRIVCWNIVDFR